MSFKTYVTSDGTYMGTWVDAPEDFTPEGGVLVPSMPDDGRMRWSFELEKWYFERSMAISIATDRLRMEFDEAIRKIQVGWPLYEVLTWDRQSAEASAWLSAPEGEKPDTPFLSSLLEKCLALGAQDTLDNLVGRVHANDIAYTDAATSIIAVRHVAEDQINAAEDPMSVTWQFP